MQKQRTFNFRPMLICAICACLGITAAKNFILGEVSIGVAFTVAFLGVSSAVFVKRFAFNLGERITIFIITLIFFLLGGLNFQLNYNKFVSQEQGGYRSDIYAKVITATESDSGQNLTLSKVVFNGKYNSKYKIRLYVYGDNGFDVGDLISFNALIKDVPTVYEGKFAADNVLNKIRYTASISCDEIELCGKQLTIFEKVNIFLRDTLKSGLDKREFAVGYALLTGNSDFMDVEILSAYRMAGVAHVFAVSGLHIGFFAVALGFILDKFKCCRVVKACVLPLILFAYSGVCSFTSSSLRASIMTTVALLLSIKGMRYDRLTAIAIAATIILSFSPSSLFDVGFQLSFAVVIGITLFAGGFKRVLTRVKYMPDKLASALSVALAAQLASIPISLYHFNSVSLLAVFLNVIFIPAVSVIFTGLFALTVLGGFFSVPHIALWLPNYVLKFVNMCISAIDYKFFMFYGAITLLLAFAFYWALLFISEYFNFKTLTRVTCSIICVIFTLTGSLLYTANGENKIKIYVCGSERLCVTLVDTTEQTVMVVSYAERAYSLGRLIRLKNQRKIDEIDRVIFLDGFGFYEQEFLTKMRVAFDFKGICCFGERNENTEIAIKKSFGQDVLVDYYLEQDKLPVIGADFKFVFSGKAVEVEFFDQRVCILSSVNGENYSVLDNDYTLMVVKDRVNELLNYYKPKVGISYRPKSGVMDGETFGTRLLEFARK